MLILRNLFISSSRFSLIRLTLKLSSCSICKSTLIIKSLFFSYDFDQDGLITKEDVKMILSHIPSTNEVSGQIVGEGSFTIQGGGIHVW